MARSAAIVCKPLAADRWRDFEGPARKTLKPKFRDVVKKGPPPGVIAYRAGETVGWVLAGPRANTPNWNGARRLSAPLTAGEAEDPGHWAISCFVAPRVERRRGVATALLAGAVDYAKARKARCINACPVDVSDNANLASIFHGIASMFEKAGFEEILRRRDNRPLMRLDFRS